MAPTAAMALNGVAPAGLVGRAVPLAFIFAAVGVLFVAYAFIRLSRCFTHAGSVYALSGVTLGPQAGFFAGWALLGTYLAFTCASTAEAGAFGVAFLQSTGIAHHPDNIWIALGAAVFVAALRPPDLDALRRAFAGTNDELARLREEFIPQLAAVRAAADGQPIYDPRPASLG